MNRENIIFWEDSFILRFSVKFILSCLKTEGKQCMFMCIRSKVGGSMQIYLAHVE